MENVPAVKEMEISIEDIKKYIAPTATDKELFLFLQIAKSYGLNPAKREIHFVKYGTAPGQTIVGYETYLKRAEATGKLDGWDCHIEHNPTTKKRVAKITIHRKDRSKPFQWEVDEDEFNRKQSTWNAMPNFMLKKVAIAQGFRLCFPEDLGGMPYIPEEMPNTGNRTSETLEKNNPDVVDITTTQAATHSAVESSTIDDLPQGNGNIPPPKHPAPVQAQQTKAFYAIGKKINLNSDAVHSYLNVLKKDKPELFHQYPDKVKLTKNGAEKLLEKVDPTDKESITYFQKWFLEIAPPQSEVQNDAA